MAEVGFDQPVEQQGEVDDGYQRGDAVVVVPKLRLVHGDGMGELSRMR